MTAVWLINPHKLGTTGEKAMARTAKKKPAAKKRTDAQKAATARMIAANKARRKKTTAKALAKAKAKRRSYSRAAAAPATKRRYKRNPIAKTGLVGEVLHGIAIPAAIGAGGALAIDAAWGNLKVIPVSMRTGKIKYLAKGALGIGAGLLMGKVSKKLKSYGMQLAVGTLTVQAHEAASELIKSKFPNLGLAGYDDEELAAIIDELNGLEGGLGEGMALTDNTGLGEDAGIGFYEPAYI